MLQLQQFSKSSIHLKQHLLPKAFTLCRVSWCHSNTIWITFDITENVFNYSRLFTQDIMTTSQVTFSGPEKGWGLSLQFFTQDVIKIYIYIILQANFPSPLIKQTLSFSYLEMYQNGNEQPRQINPDFQGLQTRSGLNLTCRAQKLDGWLKENHWSCQTHSNVHPLISGASCLENKGRSLKNA